MTRKTSQNSSTSGSSVTIGKISSALSSAVPISPGLSNSFSTTSVANISKSAGTGDGKSKELPTVVDIEGLWNDIILKVLPLFNGEGLRDYIEELNRTIR